MEITEESLGSVGLVVKPLKIKAMAIFDGLLKNNSDGWTSDDFRSKATEAGFTPLEIAKTSKYIIMHLRARGFITKSDRFRSISRNGRSYCLPVWMPTQKAQKRLTMADYI
jgi:hypothetical protein